ALPIAEIAEIDGPQIKRTGVARVELDVLLDDANRPPARLFRLAFPAKRVVRQRNQAGSLVVLGADLGGTLKRLGRVRVPAPLETRPPVEVVGLEQLRIESDRRLKLCIGLVVALLHAER